MGLLERVTIFTFTLWMAVVSVVLARDSRRVATAGHLGYDAPARR